MSVLKYEAEDGTLLLLPYRLSSNSLTGNLFTTRSLSFLFIYLFEKYRTTRSKFIS